MTKENLAAIDLGTNSCRLTIADHTGKFLYRDSIATKLGEGLHEKKEFTSAAFARGLKAFENYSKILEKYNVRQYRAIATASCRMAKNGLQFMEEVKSKTGVDLEIIDGVEEARLNLLGAVQNAASDAEYVVVYDLGGGSTELTLAKIKPDLEILYTVSIPWGARNAAEAFDLENFKPENYQKLHLEIKKWVDDFNKAAELDKYREKACLIATSSTPLRLVSMVKNYGSYERQKSDGKTVKIKDVDKQIEKSFKMSLDERIDSSYIGENRAPIFISACTIFQTIYQGLKFENLTASLKGAQDGIIQELINHG